MKNKINVKQKIILIFFIIFLISLLFLPVKSIIKKNDKVNISNVTIYYKGIEENNITYDIKTDDLGLMLTLYNTSIFPTEARGHNMNNEYYVINGSINENDFSISADKNEAYFFYNDKKYGYKLKNGDTLIYMIHSARKSR